MPKKIHIGTSGWSFEHWKKSFYPEGLGTAKWLHYYADHFSTVEINNTFYRMPSLIAVKNWGKQVPEGFLFSIKTSQYITHRKRLKECKASVTYFLNRLKPLKDKMGIILIQLPPSFKCNLERLEQFITYLKPEFRYVFEFRHDTWYTQEVYSILSAHNIAICITDLNGIQSPEVFTADFTYLRLHGPHKAYVGSYGPKRLSVFKEKFRKWARKVEVFCYFDNDDKGYAIKDAQSLLKMLAK